MSTTEHIKAYLNSQEEAKRGEMQKLHETILREMIGAKLWYLDGRNEEGKVVSNPSFGYGSYIIRYADGKTKEFYQIGLSGNTAGISVYIMGLDDKKYLANTFGDRLGKAAITGYCLRFKSLKDIDIDVLMEAVRSGVEHTGEKGS